jgi:hypothetical protein
MTPFLLSPSHSGRPPTPRFPFTPRHSAHRQPNRFATPPYPSPARPLTRFPPPTPADAPTQRIVNLIASLPFFDVKRGESENNFNDLTAGLVAAANANLPPPNATPNDPRTGGRGAAARASDVILRDATRPLKNVARKRPLLESRVLRDALKALCGELTFLEAFDRTGRVLNIVVTRSDGRAPPLLCNYLTTPQVSRGLSPKGSGVASPLRLSHHAAGASQRAAAALELPLSCVGSQRGLVLCN